MRQRMVVYSATSLMSIAAIIISLFVITKSVVDPVVSIAIVVAAGIYILPFFYFLFTGILLDDPSSTRKMNGEYWIIRDIRYWRFSLMAINKTNVSK